MKEEIYVSVDTEADGPIPGVYSMLSMGMAAYKADKTLVATFEANLETLPGAIQDPDTMSWWRGQPAAWNAHRQNIQTPEAAMRTAAEWVRSLPGKPVFVGYPAGFDFTLTHWYFVKFTGSDPFGFSALDMKTFAMVLLGSDWAKTTKRNFPRSWFEPGLPHTHKALDDAIEQGALFCNMLAAARALQGQQKAS